MTISNILPCIYCPNVKTGRYIPMSLEGFLYIACNLTWRIHSPPITLTKSSKLVGHDSLYKTRFVMEDFINVPLPDTCPLDPEEVREYCKGRRIYLKFDIFDFHNRG